MNKDIKTDQGKLKKLLKLIILMASEWHTIEELSVKLNCSNRTIYRYFKLFESVGLEISRSATANIKNNSGTFIFKLNNNQSILNYEIKKRNTNLLSDSLNFITPVKIINSSKKNEITVVRYLKSEHENPICSERCRIALSNTLIKTIKERYFSTEENSLLEKHGIKQEYKYKAAFSFGGGEHNVVCFNPSGGMPFYNMNNNKAGVYINNKHLTDLIFETFNVDKKKYGNIILGVEFLIKLNGLDLYKLTLKRKISIEEMNQRSINYKRVKNKSNQ